GVLFRSISSAVSVASESAGARARILLNYLRRDRLALAAAVFLVLLAAAAVLGPWLMGDAATRLGLRQRNLAPFDLDAGWLYLLGADTLGRPILARLVVGASNTLAIAAAAVRSEE